MKLLSRLAILSVISISLLACKNDKKEPVKVEDEIVKEAPQKVQKAKKELSTEEKEQINSVMSKLMVTGETKMFASALVTTGLTEMLSKKEGPYTVFAPSTQAFDSLTVETRKEILNVKNKEKLRTLLQNHIVEGEVTSSMLLQKTKGNSNTLKTMGGAVLTVSKEGMDIIIKDEKGAKATVGKSDIMASNGVVHVLNEVLTLD